MADQYMDLVQETWEVDAGACKGEFLAKAQSNHKNRYDCKALKEFQSGNVVFVMLPTFSSKFWHNG